MFSEGLLQMLQDTKNCEDFLNHDFSGDPKLAKKALKVPSPFSTICLFNSGTLTLLSITTKSKSREKAGPGNRIAVSKTEPIWSRCSERGPEDAPGLRIQSGEILFRRRCDFYVGNPRVRSATGDAVRPSLRFHAVLRIVVVTAFAALQPIVVLVIIGEWMFKR